jgi:hypothetical protein
LRLERSGKGPYQFYFLHQVSHASVVLVDHGVMVVGPSQVLRVELLHDELDTQLDILVELVIAIDVGLDDGVVSQIYGLQEGQ